MRDVIFIWVMRPCSLADEYQYFGISCYAVFVEEEIEAGRLCGYVKVVRNGSAMAEVVTPDPGTGSTLVSANLRPWKGQLR
jgi:hypothetical protein